jgi:hypothetical protein
LFRAAVRECRRAPDDLKRHLVLQLHVNCKHGAIDDAPAKQLIASWLPIAVVALTVLIARRTKLCV